MGTRLVFPREVQIDIGYLVSIETEEGFKRNILPVFAELVATVWTILVRHIKTRSIRTVCDEFTILALAADIVRRKWIDLGDPNHGRNKAGSDGSTRSNQVAPLIGTVHQHLRCQINHGKAIPQDRGQFLFNSQIDNIRKRITIDLKGTLIGQFRNRFFGLVDKWRIEVALDHFDRLKGLCECIGVFNNNLTCQVFSQKGKFIQHFIGGSKMRFWKWRWLGIFSVPNGPVDHSPLTETTDNDLPIDLIFRLQIVDISCRKNRLAKAISHFDQALDYSLELVHILDLLLGNEGRIDSRWHHLDKVVVLGHFDCRIHTLRHDGIKNFPF